MNESLDPLEDFKTVVRNLTDDALKVLNKIVTDEMGKPKREQKLLDDDYQLFNYLHLLQRLVSSKKKNVVNGGRDEEELKEEGYVVITARNGKEAIQRFEEKKPDLVILDIVMPVMDGMEALGRIAGKGRKIPIIFHTAYSGYRQDFMSWAADAYIMKSIDLTGLKKKVQELLGKNYPQSTKDSTFTVSQNF